ncbi:hypothetical protein WG909_06575 [Peptostreptococcaceae bacterium AGR-M142]
MTNITKKGYIHDSLVESYFIDSKNKKIVLNLLFDDGYDRVKVNVTFKNVLTHLFEHNLDYNIIYSIDLFGFYNFMKFYKDYILKMYYYGLSSKLSLDFKNQTEKNKIKLLKIALNKNDYLIYNIDSSLGLYGFVICKDVEVEYLEHIQLKKEE